MTFIYTLLPNRKLFLLWILQKLDAMCKGYAKNIDA